MNLQHEKIEALCEKLQLFGIAQNYLKICTETAKEEGTFTGLVEQLLDTEWKTRQMRKKTTLTRLAGFPTIKTLDAFDFVFAQGINKKQIIELSSFYRKDGKYCFTWSKWSR